MAVVKADAYGHGLIPCAQAALGQELNSHTASWSIVRRGSTRL